MIGKIETSQKKNVRRFLEDFLERFDTKTDFIEVDSEEFKITFSIFTREEEPKQ